MDMQEVFSKLRVAYGRRVNGEVYPILELEVVERLNAPPPTLVILSHCVNPR